MLKQNSNTNFIELMINIIKTKESNNLMVIREDGGAKVWKSVTQTLGDAHLLCSSL